MEVDEESDQPMEIDEEPKLSKAEKAMKVKGGVAAGKTSAASPTRSTVSARFTLF